MRKNDNKYRKIKKNEKIIKIRKIKINKEK